MEVGHVLRLRPLLQPNGSQDLHYSAQLVKVGLSRIQWAHPCCHRCSQYGSLQCLSRCMCQSRMA